MGPLLEHAAASGIESKAIFEAMKPSSELCPGEHAYTAIQGLGLAHMDAHLRQHADASALLSGDLAELLLQRGVGARTIA